MSCRATAHCRGRRVSWSVRFVAAAGLFLLPRAADAQRERLVVRLDAFGATGITAPQGATAPDDYTQRSLHVQAAHRLLRDGGNTMLLLGVQYRGARVRLPTLPTPGNEDGVVDLAVAVADLGVFRTLNDRHTLIAVLRPGAYGTVKDVGQLRVEGAVFVDRIVSPRTTVGAGLSYASSFGRVLPIPVVHVVARPRRQLLVDALLPSRADLWWLPRKGLDLGLGAALTGAQYGLPDNLRVVDGADALWLANATIGPQLRWTPGGGKVQVTADAGATVLRRLIYARGGEEVADLAPGNVVFGRAGVQWLF